MSCNGISQMLALLPLASVTIPCESACMTPISPPGKLANNTPNAMGTSNSGSYFFTIPK